jgi:Ca2+-binding EF-hand superfamily protein
MKGSQLIGLLALTVALAAPSSASAQGRGQEKKANAQQQNTTREMQMRFRGMDTDNDGVITRDEWRGSDESFRQHDTNHDGVLSGAEVWVPAGEQENAPDRSRREERIARFNRMDTNGDRRISLREWTGDRASFNRMDRNSDEFISRNEFLDFTLEGPVGTSGSQTETRAYQSGYQKGLEEGRQAGREDKSVNGGKGQWDLEGQRELEQADSGYRNELGARSDYQTGYRAGFRVGYREGFGPRTAADTQAETRAYQAGYQKGLEEGRQAGREDKNVNGGKWDLEGQRELEQADSGYRNELGTRTDYQAGYRAGFRLGYREGFGPR